MNELKDRQDMLRGAQAQEVLDNPIYQEAYTALRADLFEKFQSTKFRQHEERDEIWRKLQVVDFIENYMRKTMVDGKVAEKTLMQKGKKLMGL